MPTVPSSIALGTISGVVAASPINTNYTSIQTAVNAVIAALGGGGVTFPKITTSSMAGGPPGSPADQDIWIATGVDANGTRWAFQYNAGSASASKWEFIGGGDAYVAVETDETLAATGAYNDLATVGPSFTMPRTGDYKIVTSAETYNDTAANAVHNVAVKRGAAASVDADSSVGVPTVANVTTCVLGRPLRVSPTANDVYKLQYKTTAATAHFRKRVLVVTPVRIT